MRAKLRLKSNMPHEKKLVLNQDQIFSDMSKNIIIFDRMRAKVIFASIQIQSNRG